MKKTLSVALLSAVALSGCATIISDSDYKVTVGAKKVGTKFTVYDMDGKAIHTGSTPSMVTLGSGNGYFSRANYKVAFEKGEGDLYEVPLNAEIDGWYWGNLLFGGLIGFLIVDPATGAMYKLPENVTDSTVVDSDTKDEIKVMEIDEISAVQREQLIRIN